jgi:hypothetical protein
VKRYASGLGSAHRTPNTTPSLSHSRDPGTAWYWRKRLGLPFLGPKVACVATSIVLLRDGSSSRRSPAAEQQQQRRAEGVEALNGHRGVIVVLEPVFASFGISKIR